MCVKYTTRVDYQNQKFVEQCFMNIFNSTLFFSAFKSEILMENPVKKDKMDILIASRFFFL